jgi:hypothetical protein
LPAKGGCDGAFQQYRRNSSFSGGQPEGGEATEADQRFRNAHRFLSQALGWASVTASDSIFDLAATRRGRQSFIAFDIGNLVREIVVFDLLSGLTRIVTSV